MKIAALATAVMMTLVAAPVMAEPLPAEIAVARRLFSEAKAAESSKDWAAAASKLRDAIAIKETSGLRFHLAYCEEQQGLLVEALNDYERAEDLLTQPSDDFRSQLPTKKESLHKRIPTVTLVMPPEVTDASLTVDDHPLSSAFLGKAIPLNPGRHSIVVSAEGRTTFTAELALNETDAVVTNAPMLPVAKPVSLPSLPTKGSEGSPVIDSTSKGATNARSYVLIGEAAVSVGALALGIGYTLAASSEDSRASTDQQPLGTTGCNPKPPLSLPPSCADLQSALDSAHKDRVIATIGFIGSGVGAAAFIGTFLLWPSPRAKVAIAPFSTPKSSGISVAGEF
jgi:hypothetical protein